MASSSKHDALIEMFRETPALAGELVSMLMPSVKLTQKTLASAAVVSGTFEQIQPATYSADLVVTFGGVRPRLAVIVEVQRRRAMRKRRSWPLYVAHLWARHGCPVYLLVLAPSAYVAEWCARPIPMGHPGLVLAPIVAGPDSVPRVRDREDAMRRPELAVLSAIVHGRAPDALEIATLAAEAVLSRSWDSSYLYYDLIVSALRAGDARRLEDMMTQQREFASRHLRRAYSDGREEGLEEGIEKGIADSVLRVLAARGVEVSAEVEERVRGCHDIATLHRWLNLAATVSSAEELTP